MDPALVSVPVVLINDPVRTLHTAIEEERKESAPSRFRWEDVKTFRDYSRGRHRDTLSHEQRRMLRGVRSFRAVENLSHKVIFELANRVQLLGWVVANEPVDAYLTELWVKNALPKLQGETHYATARDGNHAIGLNWHASSSRVVVSRMRWWDGKAGVWVAYGSDGTPTYAVNEWQEGGATRRTVYYDDRIERYIARGGSWSTFQLSDDEAWPQPWVKRDGSPLHLPIVHFRNGSDDDTPYGRGVLDGGTQGLQDDANDIQNDATVAARMTAYQMYYATGVKPATDDAGDPIAVEVGPGVFLENESPDARYGAIAAGDMSQLLSARRVKIEAISINTGVPFHLITGGDWPSGEALLRAEMPLINQAVVFEDAVNPEWATVAHRATELTNTFGSGTPLDENVMIEAEFAPVERRDDLTIQQIEREKLSAFLIKRELGWSLRRLMTEYGLSDDEITTMETERKKELADAGMMIEMTDDEDEGNA